MTAEERIKYDENVRAIRTFMSYHISVDRWGKRCKYKSKEFPGYVIVFDMRDYIYDFEAFTVRRGREKILQVNKYSLGVLFMEQVGKMILLDSKKQKPWYMQIGSYVYDCFSEEVKYKINHHRYDEGKPFERYVDPEGRIRGGEEWELKRSHYEGSKKFFTKWVKKENQEVKQ